MGRSSRQPLVFTVRSATQWRCLPDFRVSEVSCRGFSCYVV